MFFFAIADIDTLTPPKIVTGYIGDNVPITFIYTPVLDTFSDITWKYRSFTDTKDAKVVYYYDKGHPGHSFPPLKGRSSHHHGTSNLTLFIYNVRKSDEGEYTCIFNAGEQKTASTNVSKYCFTPKYARILNQNPAQF